MTNALFLQAIARLRAEAALRAEAEKSSRSLAHQGQATDQLADQKPAKRAKISKRLATCPGITSASSSGKIMRPLPTFWGPKEEPESGHEVKKETNEPVYKSEVRDVKTKAEVTDVKLKAEVGDVKPKTEARKVALQDGRPTRSWSPDSTLPYSPAGKRGKRTLIRTCRLGP